MKDSFGNTVGQSMETESCASAESGTGTIPFWLRRDPLLMLWISALILLGGWVNGASVIRFGLSVSHMTGNTTQLVLASGRQIAVWVGDVGGVLLCFLLGAMVAGMLFPDRTLRPVRRYGAVLFGMAISMAVLDLVFAEHRPIVFVLAALLGIQNGMFIHYRQVLVRTTHLTGTVTDLGFALGSVLCGHRNQLWKVFFYGANLLCFVLGVALSVGIQVWAPDWLLRGIAVAYFLLALYAYFYRHHFLHAEPQ